MTPKDALIRGGHKHPEQILADLEAGGFIVSTQDELDFQFRYGYDEGYRKALDVGKVRFS